MIILLTQDLKLILEAFLQLSITVEKLEFTAMYSCIYIYICVYPFMYVYMFVRHTLKTDGQCNSPTTDKTILSQDSRKVWSAWAGKFIERATGQAFKSHV